MDQCLYCLSLLHVVDEDFMHTSCPLNAALNNDSGQYEWSPKALRVFEIEHPQPGGDVAAIKAGHVSVTPLDCGFAAGSHVQALQGDALDESRSAKYEH